MTVVAMLFPTGLAQLAVTVTASGAFPLAGDACREQSGGSGGVTVMPVESVMLPEAAVIWAMPMPTAVAKPPALIEATVGVSEVQATEAVRSWVLSSV